MCCLMTFGDWALNGVLLAHASRSTLRLTFPAGVFGSSASTNSTWRGYSCWLRRVRTETPGSRCTKASEPGARLDTTKAFTTWPRRFHPARRWRRTSRTSGCFSTASSISTALMVQPAEMMTSSARPPWIEITVFVDAAEILGRETTPSRRQSLISPMTPGAQGLRRRRHGPPPCTPGTGLAERARLDGEIVARPDSWPGSRRSRWCRTCCTPGVPNVSCARMPRSRCRSARR